MKIVAYQKFGFDKGVYVKDNMLNKVRLFKQRTVDVISLFVGVECPNHNMKKTPVTSPFYSDLG